MLRIIGRRPDGYHELQTVFQFLDWGDRLRFTLRRDGHIRCLPPLPGVPAEQNLVVRAAKALQAHCRTPLGVEIELEKRLPMGGGLGGGSSNAATTLVVLNQLWGCHLDNETLAKLGLTLGADVPIFVHGRAAWAEGVGERLHPLDPPEPWYLVVQPGCQVATGEIFSHPQLTRDAEPIKIRDFLAGLDENSCEPLVRRLYPEVDEAIRWLNRHTRGRLTGTGSSVFGAFRHREQAQALLDRLPPSMGGFVAKGCNQSPLHGKLNPLVGASPSG